MNLIVNEMVIRKLSSDCRTYDGIIKLMASTKNRLQATMDLTKDEVKIQPHVKLMESLKSKVARDIDKSLLFWPIYNEWLINVRGAGSFIAGNLILLYYYRFVPYCIDCGAHYAKDEKGLYNHKCPECGKESKGKGILKTKIERKEFTNVSKWWKYCGRGPIDDGKLPKGKRGAAHNWSARGRQVSYQFGDQVNRQKSTQPYKAYFDQRKAYRVKTHPEASLGHRHNMARSETGKLFLSHFWHVARTLEGLSTAGPYIVAVGGHTGIIPPYHWKE